MSSKPKPVIAKMAPRTSVARTTIAVQGARVTGTVGTVVVPGAMTVPAGGQHGRPVVTGRCRQQS